MLVMRKSNCMYIAYVVVTLSGRGGRTVKRLRENSLNLCTVVPSRPLIESDDTICYIHTI